MVPGRRSREDPRPPLRPRLQPGSVSPRHRIKCRSASRRSPRQARHAPIASKSGRRYTRNLSMAPPKPVEAKRRYFSVEEANRTLPLVKAIVTDIVHQFRVVNDLKQRLAAVLNERRRPSSDPYSEELAQTQAELETEEEKLATFIDELTRLGVELKGPDGLCDFYSIMDGREVYLFWRLE